MPIIVGIVASSCAFIALSPLCRLDSPASVRPSSTSRSNRATWTEEDKRKWTREEVLQAFLDSPDRKGDDYLGLLAILLYDSYCRKENLDRFESLLWTVCQRLGQLRIKGLGYIVRGRGVQELRAELLAASENRSLKQRPFKWVNMKDLPLTNEDVKTAVVGLLICRWLTAEFGASVARVKKEGGLDMVGMKISDALVQEHVKSFEVMAHWGPTEIWILYHTVCEALKVIHKPEVKAALKEAGCDVESTEIQRMYVRGFAWASTMLKITKVEYDKYATENIIRIQ